MTLPLLLSEVELKNLRLEKTNISMNTAKTSLSCTVSRKVVLALLTNTAAVVCFTARGCMLLDLDFLVIHGNHGDSDVIVTQSEGR